MENLIPEVIQIWHEGLSKKDTGMLDTLLAENVVFYSPVLFTPQEGKAITTLYLTAAFHVLAGDTFHYVREVYGTQDAILEFETEIDGITVNGVDIIEWNDKNQIVLFKVMVRPFKAVQKLHEMMAAMLSQMNKD